LYLVVIDKYGTIKPKYVQYCPYGLQLMKIGLNNKMVVVFIDADTTIM